MGWEYSDTDCKYGNVCPSSPRCIARIDNTYPCYIKDTRTFYQKLFGKQDQIILRNEYKRHMTKTCGWTWEEEE